MDTIKQRLQRGEIVNGTFLSFGNAITTEIVANAGFDWLMIDLEHGMGSEADVLRQLQCINAEKVSSVIRVESYQRQRINRVLDFGAQGIMCPRIENAAEVEQVVQAMRYPPEGRRGVARLIRASEYGSNFNEYRTRIAEDLLCVIQIETLQALENISQIAAVPGVDVLFIGPSDLSMALGIFGELQHPLFSETVERIIQAAREAGKHVGILLSDPLDQKKYYEKGIRFFAYGTDAYFLNQGARQAAMSLRELNGRSM